MMRKIIRYTYLGLLIIVAAATHSCGFIHNIFSDEQYFFVSIYAADLTSLVGSVAGGGTLERNGIGEVYVNNKVEKRIRTTVTGNFFKKTKTQEVFYIGHIYDAVIGSRGLLLQYDDYMVIVPEKEHKFFVIKKTVNNDKGSIVTESHESEWQNLDWSKVGEYNSTETETDGGKNMAMSRCIYRIQEIGNNL